jgi:hypothetical protein
VKKMIRLNLYLILICLIFLIGVDKRANGAAWFPYASSNEGSFEFDLESLISSAPNVIKVWTKEKLDPQYQAKILKKGYDEGGHPQAGSIVAKQYIEKYKFSKKYWEIDCKDRTSKILQIHDYDKNDEIFHSTDALFLGIAKSTSIVPETIMEALYKMVCPSKK